MARRKYRLIKRLFENQVIPTSIPMQMLQLYLLVGIPGERWDEVESIAPLVRELLRLGPPGGITLSINGLVPKAGTPLQWEAAPDKEYLRRARQFFRRALPRRSVELIFESPDWTRWQALLSLGDRSVSHYILEAAQGSWRQVLARANIEVDILAGQGRWPDGNLPWQHIAQGPAPAILRQERINCWQRRYIPPAQLLKKE